MVNPASLVDLEAVWPFPSAVPTYATARLDAAWRALQAESPGIADRLTAETVDRDTVIDVIVAATIRTLRNPDGYVKGSTSIDDRTKSWELSDQATSTDLYFTAAELRRVAGTSAASSVAFTIRPGVA